MKKIIKVPIFFHKLEIYQFPTMQESIQKSNIIIDNARAEDFNALTVYVNRGTIALLFQEQKCNAGLIAHEALHAVNYILADIGQSPDRLNDEMECYFLQWIVSELHKCLNVNK